MLSVVNAASGRAGSKQRYALPWVVLAAGMVSSVILFIVVRDNIESTAASRFERQASDAKHVIEARIQSYADILYGVRALFATHAPISRVQFHRLVRSLDLKNRYPGFEVVNYAVNVQGKDKQRFEQNVRSDTSLEPGGYPNFAIKPPGDRPEYHVLIYLEPMGGNEFAFGLDLFSGPKGGDPRAAAAEHEAQDSGRLTVSGRLIRVIRAKEFIGLAMRLAVYRSDMPVGTAEERRAAYDGSVGAGFNVENLMRGVLNDETLRYIRFKLYDAGRTVERLAPGTMGEDRLLFDSSQLVPMTAEPTGANPDEVFKRILPIEIGSRIWEAQFIGRKDAIIGRVDRILPWTILATGLFSSLLLFGMFYSLASSRSRALAIAHEITKDLRESESSLAEAQHIAHLGNWSLDPSTWNMHWSEETFRIFGLDPQQIQVFYSDFLRRVHEDDRTEVDRTVRRAVETAEDSEIEHRILVEGSGTRWAHTIIKPTRYERKMLVPGTIMDITERKLAQDELQAMSRRLVDIQELERRQFSRELHDRIGQNLTALSLNLDILQAGFAAGDKTLVSRLDDSADLVEATAGAVENVIAELRPPMLDDYGLLPALEWYGNEFAARTGIQVKVCGEESMQRLASATEIALFRIAQEALNNIAKHAHARTVDITLERGTSQCTMVVADDGAGFDVASLTSSKRRPSLGMVTMRERTQAVGGSFQVDSAPGCGTRIVINLPY